MRYAAITALAVWLAGAVAPVIAAKPPNYTTIDSVTVRDDSGDGIVSDTGAPYLIGQSGVTGQIYTGGSGDLAVSFGTRTMTANTVAPFALLGGPYPTAPTSLVNLGVVNIWGVQVGTSQTRSAAFGHATGLISFGDHNDGAGAFSTQVIVTRVSQTEWLISTDNTNAQAVYSTQVRRKSSFTAEYILPFQIDVVCGLCGA
jgi:hypothetical protein